MYISTSNLRSLSGLTSVSDVSNTVFTHYSWLYEHSRLYNRLGDCANEPSQMLLERLPSVVYDPEGWQKLDRLQNSALFIYCMNTQSLRCFESVGWASGRASGLKNWVIRCWCGYLSGVTDWLYLFASKHTHSIAQAFKKNNRGRLPERHEYLSMLATFTTKWYNTGAQIHKKHKKKNTASIQADKSQVQIVCIWSSWLSLKYWFQTEFVCHWLSQ